MSAISSDPMVRTWFWAHVVSALVIVGSLTWAEAAEDPAAQQRLEAQITPPGAKRTSDQFWAEAIFLSLPGSESSVATVRYRLTAALLGAERKAPLYRALSTRDSSPSQLRELFHGALADNEKALAAEIAAETSANASSLRDAPPAVVDQTLRSILARSLQRANDPRRSHQQAAEINVIMKSGTEFSRECLAAALAEEPD